MRLPFKTRRQLKAEIEHLTEQLRIETEARRKDAAAYRSELTEMDDKHKVLVDHAKTLKDRLEQLLDAERTINSLAKELKETKDINAGLSSTVTDLKQRNSKLAEKIRKLEEQSNTYVAKKKGARQ